MKLSKIVKKLLREQEEIEPIGGPTTSPNELAYFDFKSWAYEVGRKELFREKKFKVGEIEYTLEEATEMGAGIMFSVLTQIWTLWTEETDNDQFGRIKDDNINDFGKALYNMMKKDNFFFSKEERGAKVGMDQQDADYLKQTYGVEMNESLKNIKKLIKEQIKQLKEQDEFCDETLYLTVAVANQITNDPYYFGYFPYIVDDLYNWFIDGVNPPGNSYTMEFGGNMGNYTLPNTILGQTIPNIVDGGTVDSLAEVISIVLPTAEGAFTQNEDGSLNGPIGTLTNFANLEEVMALYGGQICWTVGVGTFPEGCLTPDQVISFMYECGGTSAGCMDPEAANYDPNAEFDDGTCEYSGCTVQGATNYNSQADIDDGSCEFEFISCYEQWEDGTNSGFGTNWVNLLGAGTPYETTSGCGPLTGGSLGGNLYWMPEQICSSNNVTCYNDINECESSCGGGDDLCDNVPQGCCEKCQNPNMLPDDPCHDYCQCCDDPVSPILSYKCNAITGECMEIPGNAGPFSSLEECLANSTCGEGPTTDGCSLFNSQPQQEQDLVCYACENGGSFEAEFLGSPITITLPSTVLNSCICCPQGMPPIPNIDPNKAKMIISKMEKLLKGKPKRDSQKDRMQKLAGLK